MSKKDLQKVVESIGEAMFEAYKPHLDKQLKEWKSADNHSIHPAIVNEPPMVREPVPVDPKTDLQAADENVPVEDKDWVPGNPQELTLAMRKMAGMVPEGQIDWFYAQVKRFIDKALDNEDGERMMPRLRDGEQV